MDNGLQRTFVMGDIHGAFAALKECLARSAFDYQVDTLIQLGDIVDGREEVYECVEELLKIKNLIAIKGNHDVWFTEFLDTNVHPRQWKHGGKGTINSYLSKLKPTEFGVAKQADVDMVLERADIPWHHQQFFRKQKLYHIDDQQRLFVHAGYDRNCDFYGQDAENYYFDRSLWVDAMQGSTSSGNLPENQRWTPFKEIYIGHTQTTKWDMDCPMKAFNIINMDTGAGGEGRLTIMDIHSMAYWQSSPIYDLYADRVLRG